MVQAAETVASVLVAVHGARALPHKLGHPDERALMISGVCFLLSLEGQKDAGTRWQSLMLTLHECGLRTRAVWDVDDGPLERHDKGPSSFHAFCGGDQR
jgi:hypothetical protein